VSGTAGKRPRAARGLLIVALAIAACEKSPPPWTREGGVWRYRESVIEGAHAPTFAPLSDHYAKDRHRVYYADTYRDGREYFSVAHPRVAVIDGADPATFSYMGRGYARDARHVYDEGQRHAVRDVASFALLDYAFARDRVTAYCHVTAIAGSHAESFVVLDGHYAKDRSRVYWCGMESDGGTRRPYVKVVALDADVATFAVADSIGSEGDARDARGRFSRGQRIR
jgi:hypothetical protein